MKLFNLILVVVPVFLIISFSYVHFQIENFKLENDIDRKNLFENQTEKNIKKEKKLSKINNTIKLVRYLIFDVILIEFTLSVVILYTLVFFSYLINQNQPILNKLVNTFYITIAIYVFKNPISHLLLFIKRNYTLYISNGLWDDPRDELRKLFTLQKLAVQKRELLLKTQNK